jgi:C-terminal processing protease CtpA/Prc
MNRILLLLLILIPSFVFGQLDQERSLHQQILINLKKDLKENYYDPNLRGIDLDASVKKASDLVAASKSVEEMTDVVARLLIQFDDSHLGFIPPAKTVSVDYGWSIQLFGEKVFVTEVADGSDANKKGIRPGDQVYMLEGFIPTRKDFWLLKYHYDVLAPQPKLVLVVIKPSGNAYKVDIDAKLTRESVFKPTTRDLKLKLERDFLDRTRQQFHDAVPGLSIWKLPSFEFSDIKVDKMMDRVKKTSALILDLRGNSGGLVYSLQELVSAFFEKDVTIGEERSRKKNGTRVLKGDGRKAYLGKLIVLIDSESASAAEMFARIVQLEGRGIVVGDQSSGKVMESVIFPHYYGLDTQIGYAFSITVADLIMKDGQRLEKTGVTPDEKILPTPMDLANGRDPVLARAAEKLGFKLTPEEAGKIFSKKK